MPLKNIYYTGAYILDPNTYTKRYSEEYVIQTFNQRFPKPKKYKIMSKDNI